QGRCRLDAVTGVRQGVEPVLGDCVPAPFAMTKSPLLNPPEGGSDLLQGLLLVFQQTQGEFPLVGAQVRHVNRHMGQVAAGLILGIAGFIRQSGHVAGEAVPQGQEFPLVACEFGWRHGDPPRKGVSRSVHSPAISRYPAAVSRSRGWGQSYMLDFTDQQELLDRAGRLLGEEVLMTGTLEDGGLTNGKGARQRAPGELPHWYTPSIEVRSHGQSNQADQLPV